MVRGRYVYCATHCLLPVVHSLVAAFSVEAYTGPVSCHAFATSLAALVPPLLGREGGRLREQLCYCTVNYSPFL